MNRALGILALVLLALATLDLEVPWNQRPTVAVIVDRTPSTRTAAWHDADPTPWIRAALERNADDVRIIDVPGQLTAPPDADVVVIFGDGRLTLPPRMPMVVQVVDPVLDIPRDARLADLTPNAAAVESGRRAKLSVSNAIADRDVIEASSVVSLRDADGVVRVELTNGDAWPENDARSIEVGPTVTRVWLSDRPVPAGWVALNTIPGNTSVVYADRFDADVAGHVARGGGLIIGDLAALPPLLREISPLSPTPPAGDREWLVLLDVSGSMGRADRLEQGLAALRAAVEQLPSDGKRGVGSFAADLRWWERGIDADAPLGVPTDLAAGGPTNLRLALEAVARESETPRDLLLLTDGSAELGDADVGSLRVSAVVLGESVPAELATIVERTGGVIGGSDDWIETAAEVAGAATLPPTPPPATLDWLDVRQTERVSAWQHDGATALARFGDREPAVGVWQRGLFGVAATAFEPTVAEIERLAERVAATPANADVSVWRDGDAVWIESSDTPQATLDGEPLGVTRETPRRWRAALPVPRPAGTMVITVGERRVATLAVPSAYDAEFAEIGNVGGDAVISEPLDLPEWSRSTSISVWLGLAGVLVGAVALTRIVL